MASSGAGRWGGERRAEEVSRDDAVVRLQGRRKEEPRREPVPVTGPPAGRRTRHTAPYHPLPHLFLAIFLSLFALPRVSPRGLSPSRFLRSPSAASSSHSSSSSAPLEESVPPSRNLFLNSSTNATKMTKHKIDHEDENEGTKKTKRKTRMKDGTTKKMITLRYLLPPPPPLLLRVLQTMSTGVCGIVCADNATGGHHVYRPEAIC